MERSLSNVSNIESPIVKLSKAVEAVQCGSKVLDAALKFSIPVSILHNRVSDIRRMKRGKTSSQKSGTPLTEVCSQKPDKYGLIINPKFFRCRRLKNPKGIYVDVRLWKAVHYVKRGGSRKIACSKYNVRIETLTKKLSEVDNYQQQKASKCSSINRMPKQQTNKQMKKKRSVGDVLQKLSKSDSLLGVINHMSQSTALKFPNLFVMAIKELENGADINEVLSQYSLNKDTFSKIVQYLRNAKHTAIKYRGIFSLRIRVLLATFYKSFSNQDYYIPTKAVPYKSEDKEKALEAVKKGLSVKKAAQKYKVSASTLYIHSRKWRQESNWKVSQRSTENFDCGSSGISPTLFDLDSTASSTMNEKTVTKIGMKKQLCLFCHQPGGREVELGKLHKVGKIVVHYYCLLFSSALEQNGRDDEGILGFLPKDIMKEINRGNKLKCNYCSSKGATIGCNSKNCKRTYHFPCGLDNFAQFVFTDNFRSMCVKHRKFQEGQKKGEEVECPICMEMMVADPKFAVWAPCCRKASWFHKICVQKLALSAGYFFKCPLCNDKEIFTPEMLCQGIFVPEQDASWELEPNAFQDLLERPIRCEAMKCRCPGGRKSDQEGTRWEILLCNLCGSTGTHILCSNLKSDSSDWNCPMCLEMLKESALRAQQQSRNLRVLGRKRKRRKDNEETLCTSEEEDEDEEACYSFQRSSRSNSSTEGENIAQPSCSSELLLSMENDNEVEMFIPEGVRGDVVISEIVAAKGEDGLSHPLVSMKSYAESFSKKLANANLEEEKFLEILNGFAKEVRGMEGVEQGQILKVEAEHVRKFVKCSLNYFQMHFLCKCFELFFLIQSLKKRRQQLSRMKKRKPFSGAFSRGTSKYSTHKKMRTLQKNLANLLIKGESYGFLDDGNTWTPNSSLSKSIFHHNQKKKEEISSQRNSNTGRLNEPSSSRSARYSSLSPRIHVLNVGALTAKETDNHSPLLEPDLVVLESENEVMENHTDKEILIIGEISSPKRRNSSRRERNETIPILSDSRGVVKKVELAEKEFLKALKEGTVQQKENIGSSDIEKRGRKCLPSSHSTPLKTSPLENRSSFLVPDAKDSFTKKMDVGSSTPSWVCCNKNNSKTVSDGFFQLKLGQCHEQSLSRPKRRHRKKKSESDKKYIQKTISSYFQVNSKNQ